MVQWKSPLSGWEDERRFPNCDTDDLLQPEQARFIEWLQNHCSHLQLVTSLTCEYSIFGCRYFHLLTFPLVLIKLETTTRCEETQAHHGVGAPVSCHLWVQRGATTYCWWKTETTWDGAETLVIKGYLPHQLVSLPDFLSINSMYPSCSCHPRPSTCQPKP